MSSNKFIKESKFLAYLLRHGAKDHNIQMSPDGFVDVDRILCLQQAKNLKLNLEIVKVIVDGNDKKRFEMKFSDNSWKIRASQGHSIRNLDETQMMKLIENPQEFPLVIHGTFRKYLPAIQKDGLKVMNRNHIHFCTGYPGNQSVISGMRNSCEVFIEIDLQKAFNDGIKFYRSSNGVVLTSGIDGILHPKYFKNVKQRE